MSMIYNRVVWFLTHDDYGYWWDSTESWEDVIGPFPSKSDALTWAAKNKATVTPR